MINNMAPASEPRIMRSISEFLSIGFEELKSIDCEFKLYRGLYKHNYGTISAVLVDRVSGVKDFFDRRQSYAKCRYIIFIDKSGTLSNNIRLIELYSVCKYLCLQKPAIERIYCVYSDKVIRCRPLLFIFSGMSTRYLWLDHKISRFLKLKIYDQPYLLRFSSLPFFLKIGNAPYYLLWYLQSVLRRT